MSIKISNKIFLVLRDSAANMVGSMRECGVQSLSCFIDTLQLSVNESIFSQKAVSNIVKISRKIVSHFNHSPLAISKLTEIQEQLKLDKQADSRCVYSLEFNILYAEKKFRTAKSSYNVSC